MKRGIETLETLGGNTNNPQSLTSKKQCTQKMHWCFTWNNYVQADIETLETLFKHLCHKYCFQEETGKEGTPHLQGVISLKKAARWTEFGLPKNIHWEKCESLTKAYLYCSKEDTRTGNIYTLNYSVPEPLELITPDMFFWWQNEIIDIISTKPSTRTVHWYWSEKGEQGKSQFCKYLIAKYNAIFFDEGKKGDIMHLINEEDMSTKRRIVAINIPRPNGNNTSYKSIEAIKDGMIYSGKFKGGYKLFNSPHLFVFCNFEPQYEQLSQDRWHVVQIDKEI